MRPKVEMPEKTESAWREPVSLTARMQAIGAHLGTAVTRQRVVPETLVGALNWPLIVAMVAMSGSKGCKAGSKSEGLHRSSQWAGMGKLEERAATATGGLLCMRAATAFSR